MGGTTGDHLDVEPAGGGVVEGGVVEGGFVTGDGAVDAGGATGLAVNERTTCVRHCQTLVAIDLFL